MPGDVHSLLSSAARANGMEPSLAQERGFDAHGGSAVGRGEGRGCTLCRGSWAAMGEGVLPAEPVGEPGPGDRGLLQQRLSREHLQPGVKPTVLGLWGSGQAGIRL